MKIPSKRTLHQIAFNHSSYLDLKSLMEFYNKCDTKPYNFLVIDATIELNNP